MTASDAAIQLEGGVQRVRVLAQWRGRLRILQSRDGLAVVSAKAAFDYAVEVRLVDTSPRRPTPRRTPVGSEPRLEGEDAPFPWTAGGAGLRGGAPGQRAVPLLVLLLFFFLLFFLLLVSSSEPFSLVATVSAVPDCLGIEIDAISASMASITVPASGSAFRLAPGLRAPCRGPTSGRWAAPVASSRAA